MDKTLEKMIAAAEAGGQVLLKYFGRDLEVKEKSMASDFYTKADTESEEAIVGLLRRDFPDYNIFAEEQGLIDKGSDWEFIIDPLDGSNNYILGIPRYSVSIALSKGEKTQSAVVHDPTLQRSYYAQKGAGAYVNGQRINVGQEKDFKRATVGYGHSYDGPVEYFEEMIQKLHQKKVKRILVNWSPCLDYCLLAEGKIESFFSNGMGLYDYVAGKLIAREAGAVIKEFPDGKGEGDRNDKFLTSNCQEIERAMLECM